jgi:DNA-3-methyladenine glycosylase II
MPTTRSMRSLSALASSAAPSVATTPSRSPRKSKRKAQDTDTTESPSPSQSVKKTRVLPSLASGPGFPTLPPAGANQILPAVLSFSFEDAKQHLIDADPRFKGVFSKLPCRPFEHLEKVDPFRSAIFRCRSAHDTQTRSSTASLLTAPL